MTDSAKALIRQPLNSDPTSPADSDYDSILGAVMETARGRWFLREYLRRNRNADTGTLLAAIDRIESLLKTQDREYAPETPVATETPRDPFADIMALSPEERIALFT